MNVPVIAFFNSTGKVGKTSLVYHLAWMFAEFGLRVVIADLDPQAHLTIACLADQYDERLEQLWADKGHPKSIFGCLRPLLEGTGEIFDPPPTEDVVEGPEFPRPEFSLFTTPVWLLPGDLFLATIEEDLITAWAKSADGDEHALRVTSAFWPIMQKAAQQHDASVILVDLGPNFSALNRAALVAVDYVIIPLFPNLLSLQGLYSVGPVLRRWREEWQERRAKNPVPDLSLPQGQMQPIGYIVSRQPIRLYRPIEAQSYGICMGEMPRAYHESILGEFADNMPTLHEDPACLAVLQYYFGMMPLAQEVHKPVFHLKPGDGALGDGYMRALPQVYREYQTLACEIAKRTQIEIPPWPS